MPKIIENINNQFNQVLKIKKLCEEVLYIRDVEESPEMKSKRLMKEFKVLRNTIADFQMSWAILEFCKYDLDK
jgi:hypothetical protein